MDGRIVQSGGPELAQQLEVQGNDWVKESQEVQAANDAGA